MKHFEERVAVITGAAGGLGRALAGVAAGLGMKLVLADIDSDELERVTETLQAGGAEVFSMVCDVRKCSHVEELADAAMIRFHAVHLLFNNAGVAAGGPVWEHTEADWEWLLGVNLWGAIHGVRIFTPLMLGCAARDADYAGHIVNTAPLALATGAVAERGVAALTETLRADLAAAGAPVGASLLYPGMMATGLAGAVRHRPHELDSDRAPSSAKQAAQALLERAIAAGAVVPAMVAQIVFDAIRNGTFEIRSDGAE